MARHTARCETLVVFPPVNAPHRQSMFSALHNVSTISGPEIVDEDYFANNASKQMSTIGELNL